MKLNQNTTKESGGINRRLVGNWVKNADRVHAIALSKLSLMPEYVELFTAKQREILPEKAKSAQQRMYEEKKQADLETAQQKLSAEYMTGFHLKTAVRQMQEVINGSAYFNGVVLVNDERAVQLRKLAIQAKRQLTRKKRQENIEKAPNLLSCSLSMNYRKKQD